MEKQLSSFAAWMAQIRANFLVLAVLLVGIGLAITWKFLPSVGGEFNFLHAGMITVGVVLAHISVNLFNEYSDYKTGIDFNTVRSPFSGGSGMLTSGRIKPGSVLIAAISSLAVASVIGIYFALVAHWSIMVIAVFGGLTIVLYTPLLARMMLGELLSGLTLGSFVVIGTYIAMTATPGMPLSQVISSELILISIPPGILTSLLLLINEFPDLEADRKGGRRHLVIRFGKQGAAYIYAAGVLIAFGIIIALPMLGMASRWIYLALIPLPLALNASFIAIRHNDDSKKIVTAMGNNVMTVLGTDLLIALAILI
ncbi:MAG: prenyltransferase [Marinilabiliales bacterium]|nr:MAG: prenyltransferase [Marinilabiliales bacterium]